ncbi:DUF669 domain-containing protein [Atopobacter sp. AH10]|uniref:DUF669 domain-containing protein n=1 Tax=Atopobacter sp. AH10 TaxID=2315861 RepID=UPI000EF2560A|nr:DUF669 domain-containing protein [Atopobacter sp. AH10]RLK63169.1 DUF669 domain-containing protein [Atopobacter sp. AH10]
MSLLEIAKQTLQNFDPKKDSPNQMSNEGLPTGTYDVVINNAYYNAYESGYECICISAEVLTGDYTGRKEFINVNLDPTTEVNQKYRFILEKNIKLIAQFCDVIGFEPSDENWEDQYTLGEAIQPHAQGKQLILEVKQSTTKKGKVVSNYEFKAYPEDMAPSVEPADLTEDDLPF